MRTCYLFLAILAAVLLVVTGAAPVLAGSNTPAQTTTSSILQQQSEDPVLRDMIAQVSESEISRSISDLQKISTRSYPSQGNRKAATYLHDRLVAIPGLEVAYQSESYRNVIATLPGKDSTSDRIIIVGAHYDSHSSDPENAPGATDNGGGVAIVLELARVMSTYQFNNTIQFAFWNAEESGLAGSTEYVAYTSGNSLDIPLYVNYDSSCYDPDDRYILDVMYDEESEPFAERFTQYNSDYNIDFDLTYNVHDCGSDYVPFRKAGYPAITTHSRSHAPEAHSQDDTIELVSAELREKKCPARDAGPC